MLRPAKKTAFRTHLTVLLLGLSVVCLVFFHNSSASSARLINRKITLANDSVNAVTAYTVGFQIATPGTLGSINMLFCANDPLIFDPCVQPPGLDVSQAVLSNQTGEAGFSISNSSTANDLLLTRTPSAALAQDSTYYLTNITNPSAGGSYYVRVQTYATSDASGASTDFGGMAYSITDNLKITSEVPPYILFCSAVTIPAFNCSGASGSIVELGEIKSNSTSSGQSQLLVATNAENGYSIYLAGNSLTSGNNVINALSSPSVPLLDVNQFGVNLRANSLPNIGQDPVGPGGGTPSADYNQPDRYKFVSGDVIASSPFAEDYRLYTVSYVADAANSQPIGIYVSTVTYTCIGNF